MERFLCLDIGDKRIGVAVSAPSNTYALPINTYFRKNLKKDLEYFTLLAREKAATAFVCGVPVNFDGSKSIQTDKAEFFIQKLEEATSLKVYKTDERCTTVEAEEVLIEQGKSREERKTVVDALAAASILEGFLNDYNKKTAIKENKMSKEEKKCSCGCGKPEDECDCKEETCDCTDECDCEDCNCNDDDIVELTTDDGKKLKFFFVGTIEYKGKNYSAFEPAEKIKGIEEDDLVIFELAGDDEETCDLIPIEDEALLDEVFEEFCRVLEEDEAAEEAASLEPDEK